MNDINEYMELFGLDKDAGQDGEKPAEDKGGKERDLNHDTEEDTPENPEDQEDLEGQDPEEEDADELPDDDDQEEDAEEDDKSGEKKPEEPQTGKNAKYAKRRRWQEKQQTIISAAVQKALEEERANTKTIMDSFVISLGLKNPLDNNKPITTFDELTEYRKQAEKAQLEKDFKDGKLTPEHIRKIVADEMKKPETKSNPEIPPEKAEAIRKEIDEQIKQISGIDPEIKTVQDLVASKEYPQIKEYFDKGLSLIEAYKLANMDKLVLSAQAERQRALNLSGSKEHLKPQTTRGAGAVTVPPDVMSLYRELMPDATEADIQKHFNKTIKK